MKGDNEFADLFEAFIAFLIIALACVLVGAGVVDVLIWVFQHKPKT
jgi:hypothetical protein